MAEEKYPYKLEDNEGFWEEEPPPRTWKEVTEEVGTHLGERIQQITDPPGESGDSSFLPTKDKPFIISIDDGKCDWNVHMYIVEINHKSKRLTNKSKTRRK